jgi:hypothetical protein
MKVMKESDGKTTIKPQAMRLGSVLERAKN